VKETSFGVFFNFASSDIDELSGYPYVVEVNPGS
jgi:hypothetical protein